MQLDEIAYQRHGEISGYRSTLKRTLTQHYNFPKFLGARCFFVVVVVVVVAAAAAAVAAVAVAVAVVVAVVVVNHGPPTIDKW